MKNADYENLIEAFWLTETSEREEDILMSEKKDGHSQEDIVFRAYKNFVLDEKEVQADFEVVLPFEEHKSEKEAKTVSLYRKIASIAASLVLILGVVALLMTVDRKENPSLANHMEITNQEEALEIILSSLGEVSETIEATAGISSMTLKETEAFEFLNL